MAGIPPPPELPEPVHTDLDSMLSRRFGREVANYFSGSPLNRLSFLRTDNHFLSAAIKHPTASFLLLKDLEPLTKDPTKLVYATHAEVLPLIGDDVFTKSEEELIAQYDSSITIPQLIFLGIDERNVQGLEWSIYKGAPLFALDISPNGTIRNRAESLIEEMKGRGLAFLGGRNHMNLPAPEGDAPTYMAALIHQLTLAAAIYAQARALMDWNARNPFCAQCGYSTLSINAGTKRTCPPTDLSSVTSAQASNIAAEAARATERPPCATRKGIHNISFPRTDPTVIMAVVSTDGSKILLGRQRRWPPHWYSTLAGFVEPAESIEEAVRREVWEESGVHLGRVVLHSTQPWPYPANLMIGAVAQAAPGGEEIVLKHDPELEDARWVKLDEVAEALKNATSGLGEPAGENYKEGGLRLPPRTAIANQLLTAVVGGFLGGDSKI